MQHADHAPHGLRFGLAYAAQNEQAREPADRRKHENQAQAGHRGRRSLERARAGNRPSDHGSHGRQRAGNRTKQGQVC